MGTVTFEIEGLVAIYRKKDSDSWTIIFPTDDCHKAKLYKNEKLKGYLSEANNIKVTTTNSISPTGGFHTSKFTNDVLDLTGNDLFIEGVQKNLYGPNPYKEKRIEILHAVLDSKDVQRKRLNYVFLIGESDKLKLITDERGKRKLLSKLVSGKINLNEGGKIEIVIDGEIITFVDGDSFRIDNDCDSLSDENDFQAYQYMYLSKDVDPRTRKLLNGKYRRFEMLSIIEPKEDIGKNADTKPPPKVCIPLTISKPDGLD